MQAQHTEFQVWTRLIFNLLRGHHHLMQMRRGTRTNEIPPSFRGIRNFLAQVASPALPTAPTATLLRGNASNWLQTNLQILESHYENMIAGVKTNLLRPVQIHHQRAWQVAMGWTYNKYRISEEVMVRVLNDLREIGLRIDQVPRGTPPKGSDGRNGGTPPAEGPPQIQGWGGDTIPSRQYQPEGESLGDPGRSTLN